MKAAVYKKYGQPSNLKIVDVKTPKPKDNEVRVKIMATTINSADVDMLKGTVYGRFSGLLKPRYNILGSDISGVVVEVGSNITSLKLGDEVYGDMTDEGFGTFAEYKTVRESALFIKPNELTFIEAATLPSAGVIALQSMNNRNYIVKDDTVLVNGAGGGMGSLAVQLVKSIGATVIGVDRGVKLKRITALGADEVIDYENIDYTKLQKTYDRIIDCHAIYGPKTYFKLLKDDGVYYMIGGKVRSLIKTAIFGTLKSRNSNKKVLVLLGRPNKKEDIKRLEIHYRDNDFKILIDKCFKLDDIVDAFEYFCKGEFVGKVAIDVSGEN